MKSGKIRIARITSNTLNKPCIEILVIGEMDNIILDGYMEFEDFTKAITGQGDIDIRYKE